MPQIDIPPDELDRLEELSAALADKYAGEYASVTNTNAIAFLLDLATTAEDSYRVSLDDERASIDDQDTADPQSAERTSDSDGGFPRDRLERMLHHRNRKGGESDQMDLYSIAAEYDITGRSEMAKDDIIEAILDVTQERYTNPFAPVDVPFPNTDDQSVTDGDVGPATSDEMQSSTADTDAGTDHTSQGDSATEDGETDSGDAQLDAMLHLLETHEDKWRHSDGDARYEVTLPDGTREPARTKDDVRALLFKHY